MTGADVAPQCANQISRVTPARHRRDVDPLETATSPSVPELESSSSDAAIDATSPQVAPAKPPKKKTAQEKRRDFDRQRDCEKCQRTCMDCIYLPFFLCASCCCRSWVAKKRKEEEHAKAKKNRERRAKAEAEAKAAEAVLADQPDLAEPLGNNATT